MKTVLVCALLSSMSIVAFSGISGALSGPGQLFDELPASPSIVETLPSLNAAVGAIALDVLAASPALGSTRDDIRLAANFSTYVSLHRTWDDGLPAPAKAGLVVCSE